MGVETVIEAWLARFKRRRESGVLVAQEAQPDRAATLGALGEALVAGALRDIGWPVLRNMVLRERGGSSEIDLVARAPAALVVIEVKTWSGYIQGAASAAEWRRHGMGDRESPVPNAVRQNLAHVGVIERAIGDKGIPVMGMVVSAGHARFAHALRPHVVALSELGTVLRSVRGPRDLDPRRLDKAWAYLSREAARSPKRMAGHIARMHARSNEL
ncbi:MAG: NERD domain-containing protein [Proteobacteria bacterium]|nr:NERD domain-containing protein [Pseudomonadota bacterium]